MSGGEEAVLWRAEDAFAAAKPSRLRLWFREHPRAIWGLFLVYSLILLTYHIVSTIKNDESLTRMIAAMALGLVVAVCIIVVGRHVDRKRAGAPAKHGQAIALTPSAIRFAAAVPDPETLTGELPVSDILSVSDDYAEGSRALRLTLPGRSMTLVTADLDGLRAALHSLRPDLKATP